MLFIFFGVLVILVLFLVYYFDNRQVITRALKKLPSSNISGIQPNKLTKVSGKALHVNEPLLAPLSKRPCIFYKIKIEQKKNTGKSSHWATILKEEQFQPFFVEKNGEYVMVKPTSYPKNYKAHLVVDKNAAIGTFKSSSPEFEQLLQKYNIKSKGFFGFTKSIRYSEAIIEVGEQITVAGIAQWKHLQEPIEGYPYSKIAALEDREKQKILITDLPEKYTTMKR